MFRSTWTVFGASSARAAGGRVERGHPMAKPPSMSTAVSNAVVRSLVGRIIVSLLSFHDDHGIHIALGCGFRRRWVGARGDGRRLAVLAGAAEAAGRHGAARPLVARDDETRARRPGLVPGIIDPTFESGITLWLPMNIG